MTIIFKSDMKSTRNMGNLSGVSIEDYSLLLDFNLGMYHKKVGSTTTPLTLSDAISLTRAEKGTYLTPENILKTADIDVPRISYDPRSGKQGLLLEAERTELLANTFSPATQSMVIPADTFHVILSVKGTGSAKLTGTSIDNGKAVLIEGSPTTATEGNPIIYVIADRVDAPVTVQVTGQLEVFSMTVGAVTRGYDAKMFSPAGVTRNRSDAASLKQSLFDELIKNKTECTIVMKVIENKLPVSNSLMNNNTIFSLVDSTKSKTGLVTYRSTGPNANVGFLWYNEGVEVADKKSLRPSTDSFYEHNYVLSYGNSGNDAIIARNGEVVERNAPFTFSPDKLIIGSLNTIFSYASLNGLVTQLIIYPYKMTLSQVEQMSLV